jgi:hypothetical protein
LPDCPWYLYATGRLVVGEQARVAARDGTGAKRPRSLAKLGAGANGARILRLMQAHPEIAGQVFDLPHIVDGARKAAADAGLAERFTATGGDFFAGPLPAARVGDEGDSDSEGVLGWQVRGNRSSRTVGILPPRRPWPSARHTAPRIRGARTHNGRQWPAVPLVVRMCWSAVP